MILKTCVIAIASMLSMPAFAEHEAARSSKEMIALADGGTLYVFVDGKMGRSDRFGRAVNQPVGTSVIAKDGRSITLASNEVARLSQLLRLGHEG